ncbi:hypothetical protein F4804DRAFT_333871 [Jackrogersella minutella]|nr:hypothetical protein F4804DRAFT_333871 [Jackrogersella minutella]
MADPFSVTLEVIGLATEVASILIEYGRNMKDAPNIVRAIALEVNILKGTLETLNATLDSDQKTANKQSGLSECLSQCRDTLRELEKLVAPEKGEKGEDSDSSSPEPRRTRNIASFIPRLPSRPSSPFVHPRNSPGASTTASLIQTQTSSQFNMPRDIPQTPNMNAVRLPMRPKPVTPSPSKRSAMSLSSRLKWPIFQQGKADELLKQIERQVSTEFGGPIRYLKEWLDGGSSDPDGYRRFIWIFGIPGAGKTVLASFLIDDIATHCRATGFTYYYCHHDRNHDDTVHFLRWVVGDLSRQIDRYIPRELEDLSKSESFNISGLVSCFLAVTRQFAQQGRRVYVVVDAVDESRESRERFLEVLTRIGTDPDFDHVSLLMTSREEEDIKDSMVKSEIPRGFTPVNPAQNPADASETHIPYTAITMSNSDVLRAIRTYVKKQVAKNYKLKVWPNDFGEKAEEDLSRNARGMFRWVACQIDILERIYLDRDRVLTALTNLPETLFDTYARILEGIYPEQRDFARTALALICSKTSRIKSADVLVQASLHNVRHGVVHMYDVRLLKEILGCLIKVTDLKRKPQYFYRRDDDALPLQKVSVSHYTVREFLFAPTKKKGEPRPAGEFALTNINTRTQEIQVVFNGLQQWGRNRLPNQRIPNRYKEHYLETNDYALRGDRRNLIVRHQNVIDSVRKLCALERLPSEAKESVRTETGIFASLILLGWPEFARLLLKNSKFENLSPDRKHAIWTDTFSIDPLIDESFPQTFTKGDPMTPLRLCVSWKRLEFLELFRDAGANFASEPDMLFKMILERGADPNPPNFKYTPLQDAVRRLEEGWVQSLLIECRDANLVGGPDGEHPYGLAEDRPWHQQHPLGLCRAAKPRWHGSKGV